MIHSPESSLGLAGPSSDNITVVLRINNGSFADGFEVTLQILDNGQIIQEDDRFLELPAEPTIPKLYDQWQSLTQKMSSDVRKAIEQQWVLEPQQVANRGIKPVEAQVTNVEDWSQVTEQLAHQCRKWFKHRSFVHLSDRIQANRKVHRNTSIPIIIRCPSQRVQQDNILTQLPWHLWWDLFSSLPNAEFAMFSGFWEKAEALQAPVRILAIFGNPSGNLNLTQDAQALALLEQRGAIIEQLVEPTVNTLSDRLFDQRWDILFFAGHSSGHGESGTIQINKDTNLRLDELRQTLRYAVNKGLRLAIFNSCDGIKLAQFLANEVKIPSSIVMRQPVPDQIAGKFLLDFLQEFSKGTPLYRSVRFARERLEGMERHFPGASWCPAVFVNPNQPELLWPSPPKQTPIQGTKPPSQGQKQTRDLDRGANQQAIALPIFLLLGLMGLGAALLIGKLPWNQQPIDTVTADNAIDPAPLVSRGENAVEDTMITLTDPFFSLKEQGIEAFADEDYDAAFQAFNSLRQQAKRDKDAVNRAIAKPALAALQDYESLIYRNNALVLQRQQENPTLPIYNIGLAAPFNFDAGVGIAYGVAQAQDIFVNEQGLNLLVTIANDSNNEAQAQVVAAELTNNQDMLAVVGHYTSPNSCAALNQYNPNGLVLVAPTSTTVNLASRTECGGNTNGVFFRTVSTTRVEAETLVNYLIDDLAIAQPNVAVFYNYNELFSQNIAAQFKQVVSAFGGTITSYDLSDPDLKTDQIPDPAQAADALVLLPDGGTNSSDAFKKAMDILKLNQGEKPVFGSNVLYLNDVLEQVEAPSLVDRLFIAVDWHPQQCGAEAFSEQVRDYWGGDLSRRSALAYEAVQAIAQAITLSAEGTDDPPTGVTRQAIRQKLAETGIRRDTAARSATSENMRISFDALGDRNEITTRHIVTVTDKDGQLRFALVDRGDCQTK